MKMEKNCNVAKISIFVIFSLEFCSSIFFIGNGPNKSGGEEGLLCWPAYFLLFSAKEDSCEKMAAFEDEKEQRLIYTVAVSNYTRTSIYGTPI